jgi:cytochrome P450/NADPH-cytochrome P450 reductase
MSNVEPIPHPPGMPLVGNALDIDHDMPVSTFVNYIKRYGEIVEVKLISKKVVLAGSQRIVHEVCDSKRFQKVISGALKEVRGLAGDGECGSRCALMDRTIHRVQRRGELGDCT